MTTTGTYNGGENFDLRDILLRGRSMKLAERTASFEGFLQSMQSHAANSCMRCISSPADREVLVIDPVSGCERSMLMFGSNNYLGLATHPYVKKQAAEALELFGAGLGGPPLLNGYTTLHRALEERLAALKGMEDAMVFSSGYGSNVGLVTGLASRADLIVYDAYSHASFCDGIKMSGAQSLMFSHNDPASLKVTLDQAVRRSPSDLFVGVEGVYSMDGDVAPLDRILPLCRSYGAHLIVDDAHGTGVMGPHGHGTAEHFGLEGKVDITMGTFSKTFAVTGGFIAGTKAIVDFLRYFARSYMFSASLPPVVIATVLAGLDVMEREPERLERLWHNIGLAKSALERIGFPSASQSAIIPLRVPSWMDMRKAGVLFSERGIFLNAIEYPAVPVSQQRFRVSIMATHTEEDIARLVSAVEEVWAMAKLDKEGHENAPQTNAA